MKDFWMAATQELNEKHYFKTKKLLKPYFLAFLQDDGLGRSGQDDYDAKLQAAIKAAKLNGSARKGSK